MKSEIDITEDSKKSRSCIRIRFVQVFMMFLAMTLAFGVRVVISIAIVAMTDPENENSFDWSIKKQSVILSSFTWGYIILQSVSGEMASKFGGRTLVIISIGVNSIVLLLLPIIAMYGGWIMVCICRGVQGLSQGAMYPSMYYLISKWVPLDEKSRVTSFVFSGAQFGTASHLIASGYIANYWGWPAIFYVTGGIGVIWTMVYILIGSDSPQVSKMISADERLHIQTSLNQIGGHERLKTPWKSIFTSLPFLSAVAANVGANWGFWTLLTEIPTYMSQVLGVNIRSNGVMSALPYIAMFVLNFPVGLLSDYTLKKQWVSVTACRKISNSIGFFGPALALICLSYVPVGNVTAAVMLLAAAMGLHAGYYNGFIVSYLDMAPNFASTMLAVSSFVGNFVSLFAPLAVGFILKDETNPVEWRIVFYITALFFVVTNMIYLIFGSSKPQKWNGETKPTEKV